jgi:hypothetical protein
MARVLSACLLLLAAQAGAWRAAPALLRAEAVVSAAASAPLAGCAAAEADAAAIAAKPRRSDTLLNVHLVAHTHDDVGWCAPRAVAARCASSRTLTQRRRVAPSRRSRAVTG